MKEVKNIKGDIFWMDLCDLPHSPSLQYFTLSSLFNNDQIKVRYLLAK